MTKAEKKILEYWDKELQKASNKQYIIKEREYRALVDKVKKDK